MIMMILIIVMMMIMMMIIIMSMMKMMMMIIIVIIIIKKIAIALKGTTYVACIISPISHGLQITVPVGLASDTND